ncbi:MAG: hypothetical protein ACYC28_16170 [Longimicrobiales bacterium]
MVERRLMLLALPLVLLGALCGALYRARAVLAVLITSALFSCTHSVSLPVAIARDVVRFENVEAEPVTIHLTLAPGEVLELRRIEPSGH